MDLISSVSAAKSAVEEYNWRISHLRKFIEAAEMSCPTTSEGCYTQCQPEETPIITYWFPPPATQQPILYVPQLVPERRSPPPSLPNECGFCKNNGEQPEFYQSHRLRDRIGRISCPILRNYSCPICHHPGGDEAHTIKYCPLNRDQEVASSSSLLMTRYSSSGRRNRKELTERRMRHELGRRQVNKSTGREKEHL